MTSKERCEELCKVSLMWPSTGCGSATWPLMEPPHQADPTGGGISPLLFKMQFSLLSTLSGVFESSGIFFYYVWKSTLVIMWAGSPRCALAFSLLSDGKCCCDIPPAAHKCEIASEGPQGWRRPPSARLSVQTIPLLSQRGQACDPPGWPALTGAGWDWRAAIQSDTFLKAAVSVPAEPWHLFRPCRMETAAEGLCCSNRPRQAQRDKSI